MVVVIVAFAGFVYAVPPIAAAVVVTILVVTV
jgi:hypothetical protein